MSEVANLARLLGPTLLGSPTASSDHILIDADTSELMADETTMRTTTCTGAPSTPESKHQLNALVVNGVMPVDSVNPNRRLFTNTFEENEQTPGQAPSQSVAPVTPETPKNAWPVPETLENKGDESAAPKFGTSKRDPAGKINAIPANANGSGNNRPVLTVSPAGDCEERSLPRTPTRNAGASPPKSGSKDSKSLGRCRVVSLDTSYEVSDLEGDAGPATDDERHHAANSARQGNQASKNHSRATTSHNKNNDDCADSSDGESSYFAKHLPSPKSGGRRFSYSSNNSAPAQTNFFIGGSNGANRESDASLSFSSDDDLPQPETKPTSPRQMPGNKPHVTDMQLYPQRITRMHSVSSLVSSGSSDVAERKKPSKLKVGMSPESMSSQSSSDPSVNAELKTVTAGSRSTRTKQSGQNDKPSGRRSPVLGTNMASSNPPNLGGYMGNVFPTLAQTAAAGVPAVNNSQSSPPMILPGYTAPPGMLHPQPQFLTSEQLLAWMASGGFSVQHHMSTGQQLHYAATDQLTNHQPGTLPFVYSEDEDTPNNSLLVHQLASGPSQQTRGQVPGAHDNHVFQRRGNAPSPSGGNGDNTNNNDVSGYGTNQRFAGATMEPAGGVGGGDEAAVDDEEETDFKVYWQRWMMLMYMSILNLLSDWTCYSVAPIAILTQEAFGKVDPEQLVVVFLGANAISTACEPIILARLGLKRTVVLGALFLMGGSIVKSAGLPPLIESQLIKGEDGWRLYLGFFLVGLSQPLYQCTPALLSASWFPESERTMATGVALNANQLGIGFAFIFGTLLVANSDDIPAYFGLLSLLSTLTFIGTLFQFEDAPPTPPSSSAKVMKGTIQYRVPSMTSIFRSVTTSIRAGNLKPPRPEPKKSGEYPTDKNVSNRSTPPNVDSNSKTANSSSSHSSKQRSSSPRTGSSRRDSGSRKAGRSSSNRKGQRRSTPSPTQRGLTRTNSGSSAGGASVGGSSTGSGSARRRASSSRQLTASADSGFRSAVPVPAPSPAEWGGHLGEKKIPYALAPSPMMPGPVRPVAGGGQEGEDSPLYNDPGYYENQQQGQPSQQAEQFMYPQGQPYMPYGVPPQQFNPYQPHPQMYQQQPPPYFDPRLQQPMQYQQPPYVYPPQYDPYYYAYQQYPHLNRSPFDPAGGIQPYPGEFDDGVEPVVTITPHHLDIHIRDDQVIKSLRACLSRPGFIHALVAFTVSGIVINTLSTFMDYLVRLNGAGREYVGIVGGSFQFVIMISSLIVGKQTDKTRAYYSVIIAMLVMGAFGLAECGVSLDADRGSDLRWSLVIVAALVGPLQPVSTELGVDVAYPLSENTVLVIQQLFSNLLSALFIPFFKSLKDIGIGNGLAGNNEQSERPEYTFSFYLLIVLHAAATVFFATFNGRYLRYEHELEKLEKGAEKQRQKESQQTAFYPVSSGLHYSQSESYDEGDNERQPLVTQPVVSGVV